MSWSGSTLYGQTDLEAFGWTNMQFGVIATGASSTLKFDFNNVPGAFGLDDVRVETVPPPAVQSATITSGIITLNWSAIPNLTYQFQSASDLNNPNWTDIGAPVTASGTLMSTTEPVPAVSQQFYRIILPPAH